MVIYLSPRGKLIKVFNLVPSIVLYILIGKLYQFTWHPVTIHAMKTCTKCRQLTTDFKCMMLFSVYFILF